MGCFIIYRMLSSEVSRSGLRGGSQLHATRLAKAFVSSFVCVFVCVRVSVCVRVRVRVCACSQVICPFLKMDGSALLAGGGSTCMEVHHHTSPSLAWTERSYRDAVELPPGGGLCVRTAGSEQPIRAAVVLGALTARVELECETRGPGRGGGGAAAGLPGL